MSKHTLFKSRSKKRGLPPGTPVYVGSRTGPVHAHVFHYNESDVREVENATAAQALDMLGGDGVTWIDLDGIHDPDLLAKLGEGLKMHPLAMEDILNTDQRPKLDEYDETLFIVLKMLRWDEQTGGMIIEQVSLVLGPNFVASFQEQPGDVFEPLRERLRTGKGRLRKAGADYLAYCLLDAIVDGYFVVLEKLGERVEALEDRSVMKPDPAILRQIHLLKREGLFLRRSVWPVRELVGALERVEPPLVSEGLHPYTRDLYDHAVQVIDTSETFREMLSGLLDASLSGLSNRMNEVMKVLTIIATLFIPLSFIAGLYGMNFQYMPELAWKWSYFAALGVMAIVAGGMLLYFRSKKWL